MQTDSEINEAVAKKLGWTPTEGSLSGKYAKDWWYKPGHTDEWGCDNLPAYSTDIKAAWEIVDYLRTKNLFVGFCESPMNRTWSCFINNVTEEGFATLSSERVAEFNAETAPKALCQAFLKLP